MAFEKFRDLGTIQGALKNIGIEISYAYEDLVFVDNNTFIIRFDDKDDMHLFIHFNKECKAKSSIGELLSETFTANNYKLTIDKTYCIKEKKHEEAFDLVFE